MAVEDLRLGIESAAAFQGVALTELRNIVAAASLRRYRDQETIFSRGDAPSFVFLIVSGLVQIGTLSVTGKRVTVEIFNQLELFGEIGVIDGQKRTADATAMGPVSVVAIPSAAFAALLDTSPAFARNMMRTVARRLRRTYSLFEDASLSDLEHRFAKQVIYLIGLGATGDRQVRLYSRMRQGDLADLLGATPRSIISILNKWRADGLVEFDGRAAQLTVLDIDRFTALVNDDMTRPAG